MPYQAPATWDPLGYSSQVIWFWAGWYQQGQHPSLPKMKQSKILPVLELLCSFTGRRALAFWKRKQPLQLWNLREQWRLCRPAVPGGCSQGLMPEMSHSSNLFFVINFKLLLTLLLRSGLKCIWTTDRRYPHLKISGVRTECQQSCPGKNQNVTESISLLFPGWIWAQLFIPALPCTGRTSHPTPSILLLRIKLLLEVVPLCSHHRSFSLTWL